MTETTILVIDDEPQIRRAVRNGEGRQRRLKPEAKTTKSLANPARLRFGAGEASRGLGGFS